MSSAARNILFWILAISFLITSPAIILYVSGYRYSFSRGIFVFTGSISVSSNPTNNIDIQVDGQPVSAQVSQINKSFHIEGLKPGMHQLQVSAPGFTTWNKTVPVRSGIATEFWNILLTRQNYSPENTTLPGKGLDFSSPDGIRFIVPLMKDNELSLLFFDRNSGEMRQVFSSFQFDYPTQPSENPILWSSKKDSLILIALVSRETGQQHFLIIDTDTSAVIDAKDIFRTESIRSVRWSPNASSIIALSGSMLSEGSFSDFASEPRIISDNVASYDILGNSIMILENGTGTITEIPTQNPEQKKQITTTAPEKLPLDQLTDFSVISYDRSRIVLINPEKGLAFAYNQGEESETIQQLPNGTRGVQFSDDGKKLLSWTDWEITVTFTRAWEVQPVRQENHQVDIGRFSSKLSFVQWEKDYEHILFLLDKTFFVTELDDRGERNTSLIFSAPSKPVRILSFGPKNQVFSLLPATNQNENSELSSIIFPEPTSFFGFGK